MKIPRKYAPLLFGLLMSLAISGTISFVFTSLQRGFGPGFLGAWLTSLGEGLAIAFPVSLIVEKPLRKVVAWMTAGED